MNAGYGVNTFLDQAVSHAHKDIVLTLLSAGADVNAKDLFGQTALHMACEFMAQRGEQVRASLKDSVLAVLGSGFMYRRR